MGNNNCVANGANPHSMGISMINNSSKTLRRSEDLCQCGKHGGFSADYGKFKIGYTPKLELNRGDSSFCWMSGREGSMVNPAGWINYDIEGGGKLCVVFTSAGLTAGNNRAYVKASIEDCDSIIVTAAVKDIEYEMRINSGFEADAHRQFEIVFSDRDGHGTKSRNKKIIRGLFRQKKNNNYGTRFAEAGSKCD